MSRWQDIEISGPRTMGECDVWEATGEDGSGERIHSCVAVCKRLWRDGVQALGGTRRVPPEKAESDAYPPERVVEEAVGLAEAMYVKNGLLSRADALRARRLGRGGDGLFDWQGGKGVIWAPLDESPLSEHRLRWHARLIDRLDGLYVGSKDQGVGTDQLEIMAEETTHLIGNGCKVDTGEATAEGTLAGLREAAAQLGLGTGDRPLEGLEVLVVGAGKVGLPLCLGLHREGAGIRLLEPSTTMREKGAAAHVDDVLGLGAAVTDEHRELFLRLEAEGRVHTDEAEALARGDVDVVSPNGGPINWLGMEVDGSTRAALLARAAQSGRLRLVAGAGNDQVPLEDEDAAVGLIDTLARAGVWFVPDPLVSPGGVIAVSHERNDEWDRATVNRDARELVELAVEQLFGRYRAGQGGLDPDGRRIWDTLHVLVDEEWRDWS